MPHDGVMAKLPSVLGTDDLPLAELCAARIDGELFAVDEAWTPVDEPDLPAFRAAVVAARAPRTLIVERLSAAWVHGALPAPPRLAQFCVSASERVALVDAPASVIREVRIDDADITRLGGVPCTTVVRTAFDLLRDPALDDATAVGVVAALLGADRQDAALVRQRLHAATRMPHRSKALARLEAAERSAAAGAASDTGGAVPPLSRR
jgi:hypothetical protein